MSSEEASSQDGSSGPSVPPDTLDFLFEYTHEAPQRQMAAVDALDNKAFALFSASAVVVGLVGLGIWSGRDLPLGASVLLAAAVGAFVVAGGAVLRCLWVRRYRLSYQADQLWDEYWDEPVSEIQHALVADIAKAYEHNREI